MTSCGGKMKVYKIRDKNTGLYSKGGYYTSFTKLGKTWSTKGALSLHLALLREKCRYRKEKFVIPDNWEILEFETEGKDVTEYFREKE